jgi:hypothetical protein
MSVGANVSLALLIALTLQIPDLRSHCRLPYRESYQLWSSSTYSASSSPTHVFSLPSGPITRRALSAIILSNSDGTPRLLI